jgi:hypothetical protein
MGIGIILLIAGAVFEYMEQPEFCGTACHPRADIIVDDTPMDPYYQGYISPGNNAIMEAHVEHEVTCSGCHDKPGIIGKLDAYVGAMVEGFNYVTGNYEKGNLTTHFENENCLKCHDGEYAEEPGEFLSFDGTLINPHNDDEKKCADCHVPHQRGMGLSEDACSSCHGLTDLQINVHGWRSGGECYDCHNREHPDHARVPFSQVPQSATPKFCGDCHPEAFDEYSAWTPGQLTLYGNCTTSCHTEHRMSSIPHDTADFGDTDCDSCHVDGVESHKLSTIAFNTYQGEIDNEFCGSCHQNEFNKYSNWSSLMKSSYGNCTNSCHIKHKGVNVPHTVDEPYGEDCKKCHVDRNDPHAISVVTLKAFPYDIGADFCQGCHEAEYGEFMKWNSNQKSFYGNCTTTCHLEHKDSKIKHIAIPPYEDNCELCHEGGVKSHNLSSVSYSTFPYEFDNILCTGCHGSVNENYKDWSDEDIENYGDCMSCHPDHKKSNVPHITFPPYEDNCDGCHVDGVGSHILTSISFANFNGDIGNDICSGCHKTQVQGSKSWSDDLIANYGDCTTVCHQEHRSIIDLHTVEAPYEGTCDSCHSDGIESHVFTPAGYSDFADGVTNELCEDCHKQEYDAYNTWTPGQKSFYGDCAGACHGEHKEIKVPHRTGAPFSENCVDCHGGSVASHRLESLSYLDFNREMSNEFCSDCHMDEYNILNERNHAMKDCIDCHSEHNTIRVDFDECRTCHSNILTIHNENTKECGNCHEVAHIHS